MGAMLADITSERENIFLIRTLRNLHSQSSMYSTCMCSNVETNLSWTCLVSELLNFEHPSVLLFCFDIPFFCSTSLSPETFIVRLPILLWLFKPHYDVMPLMFSAPMVFISWPNVWQKFKIYLALYIGTMVVFQNRTYSFKTSILVSLYRWSKTTRQKIIRDHWWGSITRNAHMVYIVNYIRFKMVYTS